MLRVLPVFSLLCLIGCASSTSRTFDVPLDQADAKVRELYPTQLEWKPVPTSPAAAKLEGPLATIAREEDSSKRRIVIYVKEGEIEPRRRTEIQLQSATPMSTTVTVESSQSKKAVVFAPRDEAYEQARLDEIAKAFANATK